MEQKINPYPGLRPFTEDESIFFKGRDLQIRQIIKQLEERKIVIITGASGDGKSSLVYAGIIPNARAGFFRAKYNNWVVADFRPERDPLKSISKSISTNFGLDYKDTKDELELGFSALSDLYKSSDYYINTNSEEWINADEETKKLKKQKAANLFILADQFEEFFTNTENFNDGKPSDNAYTTVNLLLETAKIAINEDLPIYIVCTMRSDFISQSVAFRGLPETIGFSQFFVPRLNRNELQQIIEEPALLSGGKLAKRLKEILINELHDGFDQLPILQHTLNQLWKLADNGNEEMDLLHLAKLAGIKLKFLSQTDKEKFDLWFDGIENFKKRFYDNPNSNNVLNTHANIIYQIAYDYLLKSAEWIDNSIDEQDAKLVIKKSFQSLTKIDDGRAVRNRMSLREITNIIDDPKIKYETVCGVLNIFRLQDSTFLHPFIDTDDISTIYLSGDTVLDITHEALIRNWELLEEWNKEEQENIVDYKDFDIQLKRWLQNDKSKYYLLAEGPLSHFKQWYEKCKPNKYWLAKYDDSKLNYNEKVKNAYIKEKSIKEFLNKSKGHIAYIKKAKKRRQSFLLIASIVIIIVLSGFTYWALMEKSNAEEQKKIADKLTEYALLQKDSADIQKNNIIKINEQIEIEKKRAEDNEHEAIKSKLMSDSAKADADRLRKLAEEKSKQLKLETDKVKEEKKIADEQKKNAEKQRKKAEIASNNAKSLSYLAIAQSISFKAKNKYRDKQLNMLLALQAYNFNKKYNGYNKDPAIYEALRFSLLNKKQDENYILGTKNVSAVNIYNDNIVVFSRLGMFMEYNASGNKLLETKQITDKNTPVNSTYFIDNDMFIVSLNDKSSYLIKNKQKNKIVGHNDFIRSACLSFDKKKIATGSRDKTVKLWKTESLENTKTIILNSRITAISFFDNDKYILIGCNDGRLFKYDLLNNKQKLISDEKSRILSIDVWNKTGMIAVGYSNGLVKLIYSNNKTSNIYLGNSGIESIKIDKSSGFLAAYGADKRIRMLSVKNLDKNPIVISDSKLKIKSIIFYNKKLYVLYDDGAIKYWEIDSEAYVKKIKKLLSRNMTNDEWKSHVGKDIKYEKTIN